MKGETLLQALVACAGVTLNAAAAATGVEIRDGIVLAEGDLDFRGTLGVEKDIPVGFQDIGLGIKLDSDASQDQLSRYRASRNAIATSTRHCAGRPGSACR